MNSFNVLDRNQKIHRNYLLEASAGTGKTFSIENIVVRLLLEEPSLPLEKILVVTFTRAATRDLKIRIRANIEKSLAVLRGTKTDAPDYLKAFLEKGEEAVKSATKKLEQALFCFDQAQIFTIHGFCARMLRDHLFEGDMGADTSGSESTFLDTQILGVIRDFLRTELNVSSYSKEQLNIILREFGPSIAELEKSLLPLVKNGMEFEALPDFSFQLQQFQNIMSLLKRQWGLCSEKIIEDFIKQAPYYKEMCDRQSNIKSEVMEKIARFVGLFDIDNWNSADFDAVLADGLFLVDALDPAKLKVKGKPPEQSTLNYPHLRNALQLALQTLVQKASSPMLLLARMARGCQQLLQKFLSEEEKLGHDDLLKAMLQAMNNPRFAMSIRKVYQAAIIDEFQDTDPWQWMIFKSLFLNAETDWGYLYLVGDPKQSIYAFRQADIYTYLSAAEALGADHHASLNTNFRSQPSLVNALNTLFSEEASPGLISLPRIGSALDCKPVKSAPNSKERTFQDILGSVHFCLAVSNPTEKAKSYKLEEAERSNFFPFFAREMMRLNAKDGIRFGQCAVLVSDRYQAKRLCDFLKANNIPSFMQRSSSLADSPSLPAMMELLQAVLHPKHESSLKTALGSRIIGWTHTNIKGLSDHLRLEKVLGQFYALRKEWLTNGFSAFFQLLMHTCWHDHEKNVVEKLLAQEHGVEFYDDLIQLAHLMMEEESRLNSSPESLMKFLDEIPVMDLNDDPKIKKQVDLAQDAINILTLHSSKGLEFDIVFALGLVAKSKAPKALLPMNDPPRLCAIHDIESTEYKRHCHEIDAEKIRQLYVAMTRAKYRLYVPVILTDQGKGPEVGCASPMELFLAHLGQPPATSEQLYERIHNYDGTILTKFIDGLAPDIKITYNHLEANTYEITGHATNVSRGALVSPPLIKVPGQSIPMLSFTFLAQGGLINQQSAPHDFRQTYKTSHTMPSGIETGNLLHTILETISFKAIKEMKHSRELHELIYPYVKGGVFAEWISVISQIIYNTLNTPLDACSNVRLCEVAHDKRYHETEFLFPSQGFKAVEELKYTSGYLKGVIDLVFMHDEKYYLVDWKSNWLGSDEESYQLKNLAQAMREHDYFLQASIYKNALQRYLHLVDRRPFDAIYGGTFYLFLRGLNPKTNHGIYFLK